MKVSEILQNFPKFLKISWYNMSYFLYFVQLQCISLTFGFAFGPFES